MALSYSVDKTDSSGREFLTYGTSDFPIAFFDDDLTKVKVPWHWHDEFEIIIITEGSVCVQIANSSFILNKGEGYFLNSGILHSVKLLSPRGYQRALIFSPEIAAHNEDIVWKTYIKPIFKKQKYGNIKIKELNDNKIFNSITEASEYYGLKNCFIIEGIKKEKSFFHVLKYKVNRLSKTHKMWK